MELNDYIVELAKIKGNPRYFYQFVKVSDPNKGVVDFEMWPHLMELIDSFEKHRLHVVLKARQIGLSWLIAAYAIRKALTQPNARILLLSMGEDEAKILLNKCKFIYKCLPDWLQFPLSDNSATILGFKEMGSTITALPATEQAGTGEAASLVIADEWDKHPYSEQNYGAIKPTIDAGGQLIGVFTVVKEKADSLPKRIFKAAQAGENNFIPHFYPPDVRPGRDAAWWADIKREYPLEHQREAEYPRSIEEALSPLSAWSFFDKDALYRLLDRVEEPLETTSMGVMIYREPKVGVRYVAGVDVGMGIGEDYSTLTILGREGLQAEVAAVINTNIISTDIFAFEVDKLCRKYFNAILAVESNSLGEAVLNKLKDLRYPNLYYEDKAKSRAGMTTTQSNRTTYLSELAENIKNGSMITRCKLQVLQLVDFIWKLVGKTWRPEGLKHDDLVMSFSIANQMLKHQHVIADIKPVIYV